MIEAGQQYKNATRNQIVTVTAFDGERVIYLDHNWGKEHIVGVQTFCNRYILLK